MAVASLEVERQRVGMKVYIPDLGYEHFVAKIQKVKTRKGKDYFISRITIPKEIINNIDVKQGDFVFFKAKKAEWFHMLEWDNMESTWNMLPLEIKKQVIMDGLLQPGKELHFDEMVEGVLGGAGATNPSGGYPLLLNTLTDASGVETR